MWTDTANTDAVRKRLELALADMLRRYDGLELEAKNRCALQDSIDACHEEAFGIERQRQIVAGEKEHAEQRKRIAAKRMALIVGQLNKAAGEPGFYVVHDENTINVTCTNRCYINVSYGRDTIELVYRQHSYAGQRYKLGPAPDYKINAKLIHERVSAITRLSKAAMP